MPFSFPFVQSPISSNPRLVAQDLDLARVRGQVAVVRSLLDEIERRAPFPGAESAITGQIVDELARLGYQAFETAVAMAESAGLRGRAG
jgi:hypothetical protein